MTEKYNHCDFEMMAACRAVEALAPAQEQEPVIDCPFCLHSFRLRDVYTTPPQRPEERNFCPRCGKRTQDIHTCTPPQEKNT